MRVLARFSLNIICRIAESIGLPEICCPSLFSFRCEILKFAVEYLCCLFQYNVNVNDMLASEAPRWDDRARGRTFRSGLRGNSGLSSTHFVLPSPCSSPVSSFTLMSESKTLPWPFAACSRRAAASSSGVDSFRTPCASWLRNQFSGFFLSDLNDMLRG